MKNIFIALLIALFFLHTKNAAAQCSMYRVFITDSMGIKTDKIPFLLTFKITPDSIRVYSSTDMQHTFLRFKILETKCKWNKKSTEGYTIFTVANNSSPQNPAKEATVKLIFENQKKWIELLYPNREERVFTIMPL